MAVTNIIAIDKNNHIRDSMDELEEIRKKKLEELKRKFMSNKLKVGDKVEIEVNDANFQQEVIEKSKEVPVVVDFWAVWCGPCVMISPILEKLAKEYEGKFILAKLNVDENPTVSRNYGIMSIPSIKMFKNGEVTDEFVGAMPEPIVRQWLEKNL